MNKIMGTKGSALHSPPSPPSTTKLIEIKLKQFATRREFTLTELEEAEKLIRDLKGA